VQVETPAPPVLREEHLGKETLPAQVALRPCCLPVFRESANDEPSG